MATVPSVEVRILGPLEVVVDGYRVALGGPKERALLASMAVRVGGVVTVSQLVDDLWQEDPPRSAAKTIQTYVSHLRGVLPAGTIDTAGGGYRLAVEPGCIDAVRFERLADDGHRLLSSGDGRRAVDLLDEANALWRGAPFAELGALRFAEAEATRLEEVRLRVVEDRIEASLGLGEARRLVADLERLVRAHPLRERLWGQLMVALHRSGRQAEALATFGRARTALVDGAGVEPGAELRAIERSLLEGGASPARPGEGPLPASTATRTVLLTDMEGSTAAWERYPEFMSHAVRRHDELIATIVERHGGTVVRHKGEGDSTFSVFERATVALAAALDIQLAITAELWPTPEPVRVRAALHTGEIEHREDDYFGRPINRAARMRSLAVGGTIVLSGTTASLVADALPASATLVDLGEQALRGVARPERLHALGHPALGDPAIALAHLRGRSAVPPMLLAHGDAPMIGRAQELDALLKTWSEAAAGRPSLALVGGEPGIGKTRLVAELAAHVAADGAQILFGRSDEEPLRPYQPLAEVLADGLGRVPLPELRAAFGDRRLADISLIVPELRDRLEAEDRAEVGGDRFAVLEAAAAAMRLISEMRPLLVVLDDLHWADDATLQLLRHLLRRVGPVPLLIIATYRDTELSRSRPLGEVVSELERDVASLHVDLGALNREDVKRVLGDELSDRLDDVWRTTNGNPFFVVAVRDAITAGATEDVPRSVRQAVGARVARLSRPEIELLEAAAVTGLDVDVRIAARAAEVTSDAVIGCLRAGLLEEVVDAPARVRFPHALVRDAVLGDLRSVRRTALHRRVADAIITEHAGSLNEHAARIAHHYAEAGERHADGPAYAWLMRTGSHACSVLAYDDAERHFSAAGELARRAGDERAAAYAELERADTLSFVGDIEGQHAALAGVAAYAERIGDIELRARCLMSVGFWRAAGDPAYLDDLERVREQLEPGTSLHLIISARAAMEINSIRPGTEGVDRARVLLSEVRAKDDKFAGAVLLTWAYALFGPDEVPLRELLDTARAFERELEQTGERTGPLLVEPALVLVQAMSMGFIEHLWHGDVGGARRAHADFVDRYGTSGGNIAFTIPVFAATDAMLRGDAAEASRRAAVDLPAPAGNDDFGWLRWASHHFDLWFAHGQLEPVIGLLEELVPTMQLIGERLALAYAEVGRAEDASRLLDDFTASELAGAAHRDTWPGIYGALLLARAAATVEHMAAASILYEILSPYAGKIVSMVGFSINGVTDHHLGILASTLGNRAAAIAHLEAAVDAHDRAEWRVLAADSRAALGAALQARGNGDDRERGQALLLDARAAAIEFDLPPVLRRVDAAFERHGLDGS